jgi:hypothetical protein
MSLLYQQIQTRVVSICDKSFLQVVHLVLFCMVEANINADGNQQEDLANCVAEVSNNIFSPGDTLLVIYPIVEQTQRMGEYDTCWRPVDNEYVRNTL